MTVQMEIDEKLLDALKVIKEHCEKCDCYECPMAYEDSCMLERDPKDWKLEPRIVLDQKGCANNEPRKLREEEISSKGLQVS